MMSLIGDLWHDAHITNIFLKMLMIGRPDIADLISVKPNIYNLSLPPPDRLPNPLKLKTKLPI